jgi:hypothetical protein
MGTMRLFYIERAEISVSFKLMTKGLPLDKLGTLDWV